MSESECRKTCWFSGERCPKCGSTLISNGQQLWCSFVGGENEKACDYGITDRVTTDDFGEYLERLIAAYPELKRRVEEEKREITSRVAGAI